ncbi:MAG: phage tail protein, partial [Ilumatobacter sp.]
MSVDTRVLDAGTPAYLIQQLPLVMASDPGLAQFLRGFDEMASALYERVGQKEFLLDIGTAPLSMVRLRAQWIGVPIDPLLPGETQRRIARTAASTFRRRGTHWALKENLGALTGAEVAIRDQASITVQPEARASDPIAERQEQASRPRRPRAETPPSPPVEIARASLGDATPIAVRA